MISEMEEPSPERQGKFSVRGPLFTIAMEVEWLIKNAGHEVKILDLPLN